MLNSYSHMQGLKQDKKQVLTSILASGIHGSHPGGLLRACSFLQCIEHEGGQRVLHVRLDYIGIQGVVDRDLLACVDGIRRVKWHL